VNGRLRYRWRNGGKLRFNSAGGLNPNYPLRCIGRTFECAAPEQRSGLNQILFEHAVRTPALPHFYLFAATAERIGYIDTQLGSWKEDSVQIVSFSDDRQRQEILLLMPPYSWVRGEIGTFFVEPLPARPCDRPSAFRVPAIGSPEAFSDRVRPAHATASPARAESAAERIAFCDDIAVGMDRTAYLSDTYNLEVYRLPPGGHRLQVWAGNGAFGPASVRQDARHQFGLQPREPDRTAGNLNALAANRPPKLVRQNSPSS